MNPPLWMAMHVQWWVDGHAQRVSGYYHVALPECTWLGIEYLPTLPILPTLLGVIRLGRDRAGRSGLHPHPHLWGAYTPLIVPNLSAKSLNSAGLTPCIMFKGALVERTGVGCWVQGWVKYTKCHWTVNGKGMYAKVGSIVCNNQPHLCIECVHVCNLEICTCM